MAAVSPAGPEPTTTTLWTLMVEEPRCLGMKPRGAAGRFPLEELRKRERSLDAQRDGGGPRGRREGGGRNAGSEDGRETRFPRFRFPRFPPSPASVPRLPRHPPPSPLPFARLPASRTG